MTDMDAKWLSVCRFLGREAQTLDDKDWDSWLALYDDDAEYWVPAWDDSERLTADPKREISLIYYHNRSSSSTPAPRTQHMFTLLSVDDTAAGLQVRTSWTVTSVLEGDVTVYSGSGHYDLAPAGNSFVIKRKKTIVINDVANTMLDVYSI